MKILAVETSTSAASAALIVDGSLCCEYILNDGKKHSEKLINLIDKVLKGGATEPKDIDVFAYSMGPGSFTGLRLGAAAIKAMAQATNKPIIAVPTLDALAYNLWGYTGLICPIQDAQRDMVYSSLYSFKDFELEKIEDYQAITIDDLIERLERYNGCITFLGDGVPIFKERLERGLDKAYFAPLGALFPKASSIASLAIFKYEKGNIMDYKGLELNYIRKSHAEVEYEKKHKIITKAMEIEDIKSVHEIETVSFNTPWTEEAFQRELNNELSRYVVAKKDGRVVGYGGMWLIIDEGHITNIAVHSDYRNKGVGKAIVESLIEIAEENHIQRMTLEVRFSNIIAIELYEKYGFYIAGLRKNYYADTNEDALVMWKEL